jgi:hypothetical protein
MLPRLVLNFWVQVQVLLLPLAFQVAGTIGDYR